MSEDLTTFQLDEKEWSMDREVIVSDNKWMYRFTPWACDWAKEPEPKIIANDWVQLLELLNKVWDLGLLEILLMRTNQMDLLGAARLAIEENNWTA